METERKSFEDIEALSLRRQRKGPSIFAYPSLLLGYGVAVLMFIVGGLVLSGLLIHQGVPEKFRITFGVVLALMGIYRFVLTRTRQMQIIRDTGESEDDA